MLFRYLLFIYVKNKWNSFESYALGFYKHNFSYKGVRVSVNFNPNLTIRVSTNPTLNTCYRLKKIQGVGGRISRISYLLVLDKEKKISKDFRYHSISNKDTYFTEKSLFKIAK